jgi:hypothetical protein
MLLPVTAGAGVTLPFTVNDGPLGGGGAGGGDGSGGGRLEAFTWTGIEPETVTPF